MRNASHHIDYILIGAVVLLLAFGAQMVYSASVVIAHNEFGDETYFFTRQLTWIAVGTLGLIVAASVDYHRWQKVSLALLVINVDDFKRINDTWGHKKGDEVLVWVAGFLKSQIRACDVACRTGGDEFVVVLPGTTRDGAEQLAGRLRDLLTTMRRGTGQSDHPVKMSIGYAALGPGSGDVDSLVAAADHAMYEAKAATKLGLGAARMAQRSA